MQELKTFSDVHRAMAEFIPTARFEPGAYTLDRMVKLMDYLGNPQNDYKVVHIAGTSGKTSTSYYMASFLQQAGKRVGLTVSPHVDEVNERIQINLKPLSEKKFASELGIFLRLIKKGSVKPTYFEFLVAFAFWEFSRQKVDYAVIEVGLGGLLDGTNVITRSDKLCIITDIGLDHTEVLGKDIISIAAQKAGIIKPHNTVYSYEQSDDVMEVLREVSSQQNASLHEIWPLRPSELPTNIPLFQRRNWYLAYSAYQSLVESDGLPLLSEPKLAETTNTYIPARMEEVNFSNKTVILDGAHNSQKLNSLVASMKKQYPKQKIPILVSFVTTKQVRLRHCLEELMPICSQLMITTFTMHNAERTALSPLKIAEQCEAIGFDNWKIIDDPVQAFKKLCDTKSDVVLVTGSFYLLNHLRPLIFESK
jgi:dihydrofolate synthase / folylpolyglutamate synthase